MGDKTDKILNHLNQNKQVASVGPNETFILPNHSGDHSRGKVRDTPQSDTDIANKKYVDDNAGGISGPGSSTDNAIVRWNGTGGDTVQDTSKCTISDAGIVSSAPDENVTSIFGRSQIGNAGTDQAAFGHYDMVLSGNQYALVQLSSGQTYLNAKAGQPINLAIGGAAKWTVNATTGDLVSAADSISAAADTDSTHTFGRCSFHSTTSDTLFLGHYDYRTSTASYALKQSANGATRVNGASGTNVSIAVNNSNRLNITSSATTMYNDVAFEEEIQLSVNSGVTADVGSSQGDGAQTKTVIQVTTCANAGDAITLPSAAIGKTMIVFNQGAQSMDVFPATSDQINGGGANVAYAQAAGEKTMYVAIDAEHWYTFKSA